MEGQGYTPKDSLEITKPPQGGTGVFRQWDKIWIESIEICKIQFNEQGIPFIDFDLTMSFWKDQGWV